MPTSNVCMFSPPCILECSFSAIQKCALSFSNTIRHGCALSALGAHQRYPNFSLVFSSVIASLELLLKNISPNSFLFFEPIRALIVLSSKDDFSFPLPIGVQSNIFCVSLMGSANLTVSLLNIPI